MNIKCTSCGASQNIVGAQKCGYCGSVIEIESAKNNYETSLKGENGNLMAMAETAIEASNFEEALQYFNRVLEKDIANSDAWLGKGIALVYTSKIGDLKIKEAIAYWKNALKYASNQEAMGKRVAKEIDTVVNSFYPTLENHYDNFRNVDNSSKEFLNNFIKLESAQDYATQLDSTKAEYFDTGYNLCKRVNGKLFGSVTDTNFVMFDLEEKYISKLKELDPNIIRTKSRDKAVQARQKVAEEQKQKTKKTYLYYWVIAGCGIGYLLGKLIGINILNANGIMLGDNVKVYMYGWTIAGAIIGYFIGNWFAKKIPNSLPAEQTNKIK